MAPHPQPMLGRPVRRSLAQALNAATDVDAWMCLSRMPVVAHQQQRKPADRCWVGTLPPNGANVPCSPPMLCSYATRACNISEKVMYRYACMRWGLYSKLRRMAASKPTPQLINHPPPLCAGRHHPPQAAARAALRALHAHHMRQPQRARLTGRALLSSASYRCLSAAPARAAGPHVQA